MQTSLMPLPKIQLLDNSGKPLAGGLVYTALSGTTAGPGQAYPKASYTDSTGSVSNPNPVVLDSAGRADIWLSGFCSVAVYDAANSLIYTKDNVSGGGGGATSLTGNVNAILFGLSSEKPSSPSAGTVYITISDLSAAPTIASFVVPSTSTSLTISGITLTATNNASITGYLITSSATPPNSSSSGWTSTAPTSYIAQSAGSILLYPWIKNASNTVSSVYNSPQSCIITLAGSAPTFTVQPSQQSITNNSVTLSYTTSDTQNDHYKLEFSADNGGTWTQSVADEAPGAHTCVINGLSASTNYNCKLKVTALTGDTTPITSSVVSITTTALQSIQYSSDFSAISVGNSPAGPWYVHGTGNTMTVQNPPTGMTGKAIDFFYNNSTNGSGIYLVFPTGLSKGSITFDVMVKTLKRQFFRLSNDYAWLSLQGNGLGLHGYMEMICDTDGGIYAGFGIHTQCTLNSSPATYDGNKHTIQLSWDLSNPINPIYTWLYDSVELVKPSTGFATSGMTSLTSFFYQSSSSAGSTFDSFINNVVVRSL